jgi:hypothetical protein
MAKQKTTENQLSVSDFINTVDDEQKRKDSFALIEIFKHQTGFEAKMWGPAIVGFGSYHYKYASGHEGDAPLAAFSPRKNAISLYLYQDADRKAELLQRLGKHKGAKGCTYINKLSDVNEGVLREMIDGSVKTLTKLYPAR